MPQAVEKAVNDVGNHLVDMLPYYAAVAGFVVGGPTGASIGYSLGKAGQTAIKGGSTTPGFVASAEGRDQVIRSSVANRTFIYGSAMVSGPLVFGGVAGEGNKYLWLVIPVAGHEVDAIPVVQFNELEVPLDASGNVTSGPYAGKVLVKKHLGNPGDPADADLVAAGIGWTAAHRLAGVAYLAVRLEWSRDVFPTGIPNIKAVVRGRKVLDPRSGLTVWSQNPALCVRDYITSAHGLEASASEIDTALLVAAANVCDEPITLAGGGSEPRYTCNGVMDTGSTPREIMEGMLTSMAGFVVWSGGQYQIHAGAYTAPTVTLTADDLRGPVKVRPRMSRKELFNAVRGTFVDPSAYWQPTDFPVVSNATYAEQDGGQVIWRDVVLPYTTSSATAQRIAKITLERSRQGITVELAAKLTAFKVSTMSTVRLEIEQLGWAGKEFKVLEWHFAPEGGVDLVLQEETAASYEWNDGMETVRDPAPDTNLPDPFFAPAPTGVALASGTDALLQQLDGTVQSRIRVQWAPPANAFLAETEIEARRQPATAWESVAKVDAAKGVCYISPVQDGALYDVRVAHLNSYGVRSGWVEVLGHEVIGKTAPPSDVAGLSIAIATTGLQVSWTPCPDSDYSETILKVGGSWETGTVVDRAAASTRLLGWRAAGSLTVWAAHVDTSGNVSSAPKAASIVIAAPPPPDALAIEFGTANIEARWAAPMRSAQQQPLDRVELAWTAGFSSVIDGKKATTATFGWLPAGTHTLFARYVDVGGNPGAPAQAVLRVNPPAQPVMTAVETQVNAVTLRWQDAKTSQPIRKYAIFYGDVGTAFEAAMLYGSAGADSRSDILFYRSAGDKVAYLQAEDVAGNLSAPRQIDMSITMPNDFVLASEYYEDWHPAELVNGTILGGMGGQIILPSFVGRTWAQRLSDNGWTTAQQKVDAGYPLVIQPVPNSGKHLERRDLGRVISSAVVRATPTLQSSVSGAVVTMRIRGSVGSSDTTWQPWVVGESVVMADFRHLEVEFAVESDGKGFVVLDDIYVRVEISEVSESSVLTLSASDAGGTEFVCQKAYVDVRTVQATPLSSPNIARLNCIVDDGVSPAKVYVQAWDTSNNRTSGTVSLTISGV